MRFLDETGKWWDAILEAEKKTKRKLSELKRENPAPQCPGFLRADPASRMVEQVRVNLERGYYRKPKVAILHDKDVGQYQAWLIPAQEDWGRVCLEIFASLRDQIKDIIDVGPDEDESRPQQELDEAALSKLPERVRKAAREEWEQQAKENAAERKEAKTYMFLRKMFEMADNGDVFAAAKLLERIWDEYEERYRFMIQVPENA